MSNRKEFSGARIAGLFASRILPGIINFVTLAILIRSLEPSDYGIYALVVSSSMIASGLGFHWLVQGVSRYSYRWRDNRNVFLSSTIVCFIVSAILVVIAYPSLAFGLRLIDTRSANILALASIIAVLQGLFEVLSAVALAEMRNRTYAWIVSTKAMVGLVAILFLAQYQVDYELSLIAFILGLLVAVLLGLKLISVNFASLPDREIMRAFFIHGSPMGLHYGLKLIFPVIERSIVLAFLGEAAVGFLAAATDIVAQSLILMMVVPYMFYYPSLVRKWESAEHQDIIKSFESGFRLLICFGLPAATFVGIFSSNIVYFMINIDFRSEVEPLIPCIAMAAFVSCLKSFYTDTVYILKGRIFHLIGQSSGLLLLCYFMQIQTVPEFGLRGLVFVTLTIQFLALFISYILARRLFPIPVDISLTIKILLSCLVVAAVLWPFRYSVGMLPAILQLAAFFSFGVIIWYRYLSVPA